MEVQPSKGASFDLLPEDIRQYILGKLSVADLSTAKSVSMAWNRIATKLPGSPEPAWAFLLTGYFRMGCSVRYLKLRCRVFSPREKRWYRVPAPKLPAVPGHFHNEVPASAGLIVLRQDNPGATGSDWRAVPDFWVGNPLTNKWRRIRFPSDEIDERKRMLYWDREGEELVLRSKERRPSWHRGTPVEDAEKEDVAADEEALQQGEDPLQRVELFAVDVSGSYKLVVFLVGWPWGCLENELIPPGMLVDWTTHIYDSSAQSWTSGAIIAERPPVTTGSCYLDGVAYVLQGNYPEDQCYYMLTPHSLNDCPKSTCFQVMAYDIDANEFSVVVPLAPLHLPDPDLELDLVFHMTVRVEGGVLTFEFLGALALPSESWRSEAKKLCVFKYDTFNACWRSDVVQDLYSPLRYCDLRKGGGCGVSGGHAGMVYMIPYQPGSQGLHDLLVYDSTTPQSTRVIHPGVQDRKSSPPPGCFFDYNIGSFIPRLDVDP